MKGNAEFIEKLVNDHFCRNCDLFARAPLGIVIVDSGGRILEMNRTFGMITGMTGDEKEIHAGGKIRYFNKHKEVLSPEELPWSVALKE